MSPAPAGLVLHPGRASLKELRRATLGPVQAALTEEAWADVARSHAAIQEILDDGRTVYGVNTGFGLLADTRIPAEQLVQLQRNLLLSHSTGTGPLLDDATVRLVLVLKVLGLARGHSGVRRELIEALLTLVAQDALPCVPAQGSVGASGDLAPLAHLAATLLGEGRIRLRGEEMPAARALEAMGLAPLELGPKEGLALINGTQVSTALALRGLFAAEDDFAAAVVSGALSIDAAQASLAPFDDRIHALRGQSGQRDVARLYPRLVAGSGIHASHVDCDRVQDPYSWRCQPQVMGACLDALRHAAGVLTREANAVTDNPLIFPAVDGAGRAEVLSGGNFHAEPVAFVSDHLALALAEIGSISERRVALLTDPKMSGLPAFLVEEGGLNSGFMIAHVTAAALAAENKQMAHPAVVDSLPTSANQEDHVSMATHGARRLLAMAGNTAGIVAVELLAACQGIDFHRPHRTSETLQEVHRLIRERVPFYDRDRYFAPDIEAVRVLVEGGRFRPWAAEVLPSENG